MPLIIPDGFAEVTLVYSLTGDPEHMTTSFGVDALGPASLEDICTEFEGEFSAWMTQWADAYTLVEVHGKLNNGGTFLEHIEPSNTPGAAAEQVLPQNVSVLVKKVSGLAGRANRGRNYFPPGRLAEVDVNNTGMIDGADVTAIQAELDSIFASLVADPDIDGLVILHSIAGPVPTPITALQLDNRVATQRRRLR